MARRSLPVAVAGDAIRIGPRFSVSFQRTLRIPDDSRTYPLPPGLGRFPVCRVEDYASRVPEEWRRRGGAFIPMYQREALWLAFDAASWKPNAVQVAVGRINAVSGTPWEEALSDDPQNYIVCPDQPWLDGINAGGGVIRQFVAMPLGLGYTIEAQRTGKEEVGGLQVRVYEPKPGRFPDEPPPRTRNPAAGMPMAAPRGLGTMGLGAGGTMRQKIYPDQYGLDAWDRENSGEVFVHIVNSTQYRELTGGEPPPTPIDAQTYTRYGFPWFELYDEDEGTVAAPEELLGIKSIRQKDVESGQVSESDETGPDEIPTSQVKKIRRRRGRGDP